MSTGEHRFRSAAFGFNRQDVIHYIEGVHKDHAAQIQSLKKDLELERTRRSDVEERGSIADQAASAAGKDAQRAREELTQALAQLQEAQTQREDLRLRLQALEADYSQLQDAADRMAPAARAYEALKDKAAGIELDAHNRAQSIIKRGEEQADQTRQDLRAWMRQVESSYDRLRSDVAATLAHAVAELDRTGKSLDQVNRELESHGAKLRDLSAELGLAPTDDPAPAPQAGAPADGDAPSEDQGE